MSARELPDALATDAERRALLNREVIAINKMREVCRAAIAEEYALGVRVCAPLLAAVDSILSTAVVEVAHAVYGSAE